jgi:hypothetical protein
VRWPRTLPGARAVLARLPTRLNGQTRETYYNSGVGEDPPARDAGAVYGKLASVAVSEEYIDHDKLDPHQAWGRAENLLSAMFGLVLGCAKGSFRGTAHRPTNPYGGPGVTDRPTTKPVWFSCKVDGAEGDDEFKGHAVGWTSGKTAWLVVAQDEQVTRAVVTELHRAATS